MPELSLILDLLPDLWKWGTSAFTILFGANAVAVGCLTPKARFAWGKQVGNALEMKLIRAVKLNWLLIFFYGSGDFVRGLGAGIKKGPG